MTKRTSVNYNQSTWNIFYLFLVILLRRLVLMQISISLFMHSVWFVIIICHSNGRKADYIHWMSPLALSRLEVRMMCRLSCLQAWHSKIPGTEPNQTLVQPEHTGDVQSLASAILAHSATQQVANQWFLFSSGNWTAEEHRNRPTPLCSGFEQCHSD